MSVKVISLKKMLITEPKQCKLLWTKPAQNILIIILCNEKVNFVYELVLSWFYKLSVISLDKVMDNILNRNCIE